MSVDTIWMDTIGWGHQGADRSTDRKLLAGGALLATNIYWVPTRRCWRQEAVGHSREQADRVPALCSQEENPLWEQTQRPRVWPQDDRDVIRSMPTHSAAQDFSKTTQPTLGPNPAWAQKEEPASCSPRLLPFLHQGRVGSGLARRWAASRDRGPCVARTIGMPSKFL